MADAAKAEPIGAYSVFDASIITVLFPNSRIVSERRIRPNWRRLLSAAAGSPFPATQRDGLRAQQVISAGMRAMVGASQGASLRKIIRPNSTLTRSELRATVRRRPQQA